MKIILSPAKKMNVDTDTLEYIGLPVYLEQAQDILTWMQSKTYGELKMLWKCNDKIAKQNSIGVAKPQFVDLSNGLLGWGKSFTGGVKGVNHLP